MSNEWDDVLRDQGYRITPQRQLVLEAVNTLGHATPEELLSEVQKTAAAVNLSTIYRTLEVLEQVGLVTTTLGVAGNVRIEIFAGAALA